jgi:hypothetical protein
MAQVLGWMPAHPNYGVHLSIQTVVEEVTLLGGCSSTTLAARCSVTALFAEASGFALEIQTVTDGVALLGACNSITLATTSRCTEAEADAAADGRVLARTFWLAATMVAMAAPKRRVLVIFVLMFVFECSLGALWALF